MSGLRSAGRGGWPVLVVAAATAALSPLACSQSKRVTPQVVPGGDASAGHQAILRYGCATCHTIPGVKGAALVGPPLIHWSGRSYIGGRLANTPPNLIHWVEDPQVIDPGIDMPNLGVTPGDARDIAAYLDQIR